MSDVMDGGKTAFPLIDVSCVPEKGSAIFWLNLYITGDGDYRTKNGECPIFSGSKWGKIIDKFSFKVFFF